MVQMTGTYTRTEEKDYDKFLSKLGVNFMLRKAATISTPNMEITETGGKWKMVTSTSLKSIVLEFELVIIFFLNSHSSHSLIRKSTLYTSLFRNKRFMLDEMTWLKASKFAIFYIYENTKLLFPFFTLCYFIFSPNECPGLC